MPEIWMIDWYDSQADTWHMEGVNGRDECRARMGTLCKLWPTIKYVSARLM